MLRAGDGKDDSGRMARDTERCRLGADSVVVGVARVAGADGVRTSSEHANGIADSAGDGRRGASTGAVHNRSTIDDKVDTAGGRDTGAGEGEHSGKRYGEIASERCAVADRERGRLLIDREADGAGAILVVFVGRTVGSGDGVSTTRKRAGWSVGLCSGFGAGARIFAACVDHEGVSSADGADGRGSGEGYGTGRETTKT